MTKFAVLSALQIESLLDESTAELAKMVFTPLLSTIEANFKLKKPVPLHTTLRIDCKVSTLPASILLHTNSLLTEMFYVLQAEPHNALEGRHCLWTYG